MQVILRLAVLGSSTVRLRKQKECLLQSSSGHFSLTWTLRAFSEQLKPKQSKTANLQVILFNYNDVCLRVTMSARKAITLKLYWTYYARSISLNIAFNSVVTIDHSPCLIGNGWTSTQTRTPQRRSDNFPAKVVHQRTRSCGSITIWHCWQKMIRSSHLWHLAALSALDQISHPFVALRTLALHDHHQLS